MTPPKPLTAKPLTGWHVLAMFSAFFGVIIAVNATLAWQAIRTFPGLEVANGYVASQTFDADRAAQLALGWTLTPHYTENRLTLTFTDAKGQPAILNDLTALIGRPTESRDDHTLAFVQSNGTYTADIALPTGKWMMAVTAHAPDGTLFQQRITLHVSR